MALPTATKTSTFTNTYTVLKIGTTSGWNEGIYKIEAWGQGGESATWNGGKGGKVITYTYLTTGMYLVLCCLNQYYANNDRWNGYSGRGGNASSARVVGSYYDQTNTNIFPGTKEGVDDALARLNYSTSTTADYWVAVAAGGGGSAYNSIGTSLNGLTSNNDFWTGGTRQTYAAAGGNGGGVTGSKGLCTATRFLSGDECTNLGALGYSMSAATDLTRWYGISSSYSYAGAASSIDNYVYQPYYVMVEGGEHGASLHYAPNSTLQYKAGQFSGGGGGASFALPVPDEVKTLAGDTSLTATNTAGGGSAANTAGKIIVTFYLISATVPEVIYPAISSSTIYHNKPYIKVKASNGATSTSYKVNNGNWRTITSNSLTLIADTLNTGANTIQFKCTNTGGDSPIITRTVIYTPITKMSGTTSSTSINNFVNRVQSWLAYYGEGCDVIVPSTNDLISASTTIDRLVLSINSNITDVGFASSYKITSTSNIGKLIEDIVYNVLEAL